MKRRVLVLAVFFALGAAVLIKQQVKYAQIRHDKLESAQMLSSVAVSPSVSPISEVQPSHAATVLYFPSRELYAEQVRVNPHRVPQVMMDFAHSMTDLMEVALRSEPQAVAGFSVLEKCVRDSEDVQLSQVRAVCAVNAKRLSEIYSNSLSSRYRGLQREIPENVERLIRALEPR